MTENDVGHHRRCLLPEGSQSARLIVYERTGSWALALGRELPAGVRVRPTRSLAETWEMLAQAPASFLVLELAARQAEALLGRLFRLDREYPLARAAVVAERRLAAYEWLVRQAGAVHFASSPRHLASLVRVARRHLAAAPQPDRDIRELIWAGLPWGETD
jgi:hypothetical protein